MADDDPIDETDTVLLEVEGPVATVSLNRPEALNALTPGMLERLADVLEQVASDDTVQVVVLTGSGRAFSAGVDLKSLNGRRIENGAVGEVLDGPGRRAQAALTTMPKVVVARINGACFTGALELVLACDLSVAADEAKFGDTHVRWGLRPTWGMSQRLIRMVGVARARLLTYTAHVFSGADAARWGLVNASVPADELDGAVASLVQALLVNSPSAVAAAKDLYRQALDGGLADGLAYEAATGYEIPDTMDRLGTF